MSLTEDYVFQFTDTGVILNTVATPSSPFADITQVDGLDNAPVRVTSRAREGQDGGFIDAEFEDMRVVVLAGVIYSPTNQIHTFLDSLKSNYAPASLVQPFYFTDSLGNQRLLYCKSIQGLRYSWTTKMGIGIAPFQIQLQAEDPSIYGDVQVVSTGIGGLSSTRGYDKSFNFGYGGSTSTAGSVVCDNVGNKSTTASIVISGAVSDPVIVNDTTGARLDFTGYTINAGESLAIDLRNRTVILNDTANRRNRLRGGSSWFLLSPGSTTLRFIGTPVSGTPTMTVTLRPAYR